MNKIIAMDYDGDSLEEARQQFRTASRADWRLLSEQVRSKGSPIVRIGTGKTIKDAITEACASAGTSAFVVSETQVLLEATTRYLLRRARSITSATKMVQRDTDSRCRVVGASIRLAGDRKFLGLLRSKDEYAVEVWLPFVVQVTMLPTPLHVRAIFQTLSEEPSSSDSQVQELLKRCASLARTRQVPSRKLPSGERHYADVYPYFPGDPAFICAQSLCTNHCCRRGLDVLITQGFVKEIESRYGLDADTVAGRLAVETSSKRLNVLQQTDDGTCVLLDANHKCSIYQHRPPECVTYPFQLAVFDLQPDGQLKLVTYTDLIEKGEATPAFYTQGALGFNCLIPLLFYHSDCPGFTGQPITLEEYAALSVQLWSSFSHLHASFAGTGQVLMFDDRGYEWAASFERQRHANIALYNTALEEIKRGRLFEAQSMLETVLDYSKDWTGAKNQLDLIYARLGDPRAKNYGGKGTGGNA